MDFSVNNNSLTGNIPDFSNLPVINALDLYDNQLDGAIPSFTNLPILNNFTCHSNNLSGCYSDFVCTINDFNSTLNSLLPWQGDHTNFCSGSPQVGAPCDDGNINTVLDRINSNCTCEGFTCDPLIDSLALVNLYNSADGANWIDPWLLSQPMSTWQGVGLFPSGCVQSVVLDNRNLNGIISPGIGNLTSIESLALINNDQLEGSIPTTISQLSLLKSLGLSNNVLNNNIPPDLGDLCELEELVINDNELTGCLPAELSQLVNLDTFNASNNLFSCTNYPSELLTLCYIDSLNLSDNLGLPDFDAFCSDGSFVETCMNIPDSVYCLDTIQNLIQSLDCGAYLADSAFLDLRSIGLVVINDISYAHLTEAGLGISGITSDTTIFVGCACLVMETCISNPDTTICKRGVLNDQLYNSLCFRKPGIVRKRK